MRTRILVALIAAGALITACSSSSDHLTGSSTPNISRIVVSPGHDSILVGQTATLTAVAVDDAGRPIRGLTFAWVSSQARVAPVAAGTPSDTAHSIGDSVGITQITASVGGVTSDPTNLTVLPLMVAPPPADTDTTRTALIACGGVNMRVGRWTAHFTESYAFSTSGVDSDGFPRTYNLQTSGDFSASLTLVRDDYLEAIFEGQFQGSVAIHDRSTLERSDGDVASETDDGAGPMLSAVSLGYSPEILYLYIDKATCHYQFSAPQAYVMATFVTTDQQGHNASSQSPDLTGFIYSRYIPLDGLSGSTPSLSGRGAFVAGIWTDTRAVGYDNPNPPASAPLGYYWGGSLATMGMYESGLAVSGQAGSADVSWSFTPKR